ncbi:1-(5-phosphoribosyl)-5-[(5-phosphoribosylamino)methylideneamino]imidazole-4-carboxamide isomerase [Stratiformator vulcanicus]|uniref:1-(5-phosphoribosyl)-5-[(5-phosphoribosylamino)methylideneamino] imidazole-4-carboxamide isomerase n=1 Tax=Stratiformator vulcanicus TaxID=2527980 RepID=A0A517R2J8_9PLAN|nr:1-(5-phosphoribosyl)-5-[(5-phosphoribosylamino)methylideneamino]imidazole-4-carboxamide isomerase [Stratiformator vulcanicus]QDT38102.1 1-(5-phosphoribosyl)-5-[(5-phosphoribosylamino)methylideneamino] imidazole-4-carboxamide isomerase [Stratiformator vulcanicus]
MQILPAIDLRDGKCVRLQQGDYDRETVFGDDPAAMAKRWADEGAEILHVVDLDAAKAGTPTNLDAIRGIRAAIDIPMQLGGGIRNDESLKIVLDDLGVDRAIVGTAALKDPDWFRAAAERYPDRLVLGIDAKGGMVATEGWLDVSQTSALELAQQYVGSPLAAVVYTNIANDGMMQGIDEATVSDLCAMSDLGLPTIASGGVTDTTDIRRLALAEEEHPNLVGAIVGRALYEGTLTVRDAIIAAG